MLTTTEGPMIGHCMREWVAEDRALGAKSAAICAKPVGGWTDEERAELSAITERRARLAGMLMGAVGYAIETYDREHA